VSLVVKSSLNTKDTKDKLRDIGLSSLLILFADIGFAFRLRQIQSA
jgi:hypothetical protein